MVAALVAAQVALVAAPASAGSGRLWEVEVAKIPTAKYTRDAKVYVTEATQALRPYVGGGLGDSRIDTVLADVGSRYFDGARLKSVADGAIAFDNLKHLEAFLKGRLNGASPPNGEAEQAHVAAVVETLTGVRLLADAAIQDAEATIGPFRASPPPAPAPAGLAEAFADLDAAKVNLAKADDMLVKANPEPATIQAGNAWSNGFNVLTRLGITYTGDHDNDGVVDVVELRFGSSPLLVDSDGDGLTDKFEITELAGWTRPNAVDTDQDSIADGAEDIDGDGLTNLQEQDLGTSPTNPDTDGDGATDGAEVAQGSNPLVADQPRAPPTPGDVPPIDPTPTDTDTDGDGLPDLVEEDGLTDPANVDTDGDGLSDYTEDDLSINARSQDSDGDGLRDDYEVANAESQGLDPGRFDEQISKWTYVSDFLLGMFAGDFAEKDSMAWLAGNLCSGGLSVIPVVGWILGGLADIRDTIAALIHGEWVSAGLSILGVVPYAGDAIAIPAKVAKFVLKYTHRLMPAARFVAKYDKIPDTVKELTYELIMPEVWAALVEPEGLAPAASGRISKKNFNRLLSGERTDLKKLHFAMQAVGTNGQKLHLPGPDVRWARGSTDGQNIFVDEIMGFRDDRTRGQPQLWLMQAGAPGQFEPSGRSMDYGEFSPDGWTLHEVKTGIPTEDDRKNLIQCNEDSWYADPANQAKVLQDNERNFQFRRNELGDRAVKGKHWHFMPHGKYDSLGISDAVLDCLQKNNIPFTIHFPIGD
ncbi:hypothetical protein ABZ783_25105 [Micromonospora sp. NPDC047738]|uniref:hypothetical protein n=1 Tax=Micromonospora sp. NPDC047738 TaxID=3155741 RepID=UPI0033ECA296